MPIQDLENSIEKKNKEANFLRLVMKEIRQVKEEKHEASEEQLLDELEKELS